MPDQRIAEAAARVGHVLAGHRIDALIGGGGMGVVYRATHLRLHRTVALKILPPELAGDREYRRRFEREAAIAASLEHPHVVPIYDAGHAGGILYLTMRFVDGEDLDAVLRREGRLDVERACALLGPVADALDAVHEAGLVHRDVKPGNVLVSRPARARGETVYLCDFGIAKGAAVAGGEITSADKFVGTLQYSSPEQIEGRWLDGRSDQYGLACLVFRGLTGEVPYPRPEAAGVLYAHLMADPPRPGRHRPDLPPAVDEVVARAAAKQPDQRFPSCTAFIDALRAAAGPARSAPSPGRVGGRHARSEQAPTRIQAPPSPAPRPTLPLPGTADPEVPTRAAGRPEPGVAAPLDVHAERDDDGSVTVTWTAAGPPDVEYKITRIDPGGGRHVVGRTRSTCVVDGAAPAGTAVPAYEVTARLGSAASEPARSPEPPPADVAEGGIPPVRHLVVTAAGPLGFDWPPGVTEAMVVVRHDRSPATPGDPDAVAWKITNMRYQLDGGLVLPASVDRPCHVAVASCRREGGALVVAPGFDPTARASVEH